MLFAIRGYIFKLNRMLNFIKNIGPIEIIVLVTILFLLFGRKIFIALGRTSGETLKEIKNIKKSFTEGIEGNKPKNKKEEV